MCATVFIFGVVRIGIIIVIVSKNFISRAVGYHVHYREYRDRLEESIRHTVEKCDRLQGFLLMHSLGGGTGSGLGTATLKLLENNYPRVERCTIF